mmetsp:Transcript_32535/g.71764  ORF Transcript_32535/g.71764 Transcript_32535/m.71764 type:complete len:105 (-) Transcript_32535:1337-1651(-)
MPTIFPSCSSSAFGVVIELHGIGLNGLYQLDFVSVVASSLPSASDESFPASAFAFPFVSTAAFMIRFNCVLNLPPVAPCSKQHRTTFQSVSRPLQYVCPQAVSG